MKAIARKELGQHWLNDKYSLVSMVEAADIKASDSVLEIGPGTGLLTNELIKTGANIQALEFDHTLYTGLLASFAESPTVTVTEGDIRSFDLSSLPAKYKIVANIPYYLTANLFRKLIDDSAKPQVASLLVQKEVAERASALPGKMSFVSVALQLFYEVTAGQLVPAHLFEPPPKVDSQILILKRIAKPNIHELEVREFLRLLKSGFSQPRKKLITNLRNEIMADKVTLNKVFEYIGLNQNIRAQELSQHEWQKLFDQLKR